MTTHSKFDYSKDTKEDKPPVINNGLPINIIVGSTLNKPDYTQYQTRVLADIYNQIKLLGAVNVLLELEDGGCIPIQTNPDKYEPINNWWDLLNILNWSPSVKTKMTKTINKLEETDNKGYIEIMSKKEVDERTDKLEFLGKYE